jgi:hypothetical protein
MWASRVAALFGISIIELVGDCETPPEACRVVCATAPGGLWWWRFGGGGGGCCCRGNGVYYEKVHNVMGAQNADDGDIQRRWCTAHALLQQDQQSSASGSALYGGSGIVLWCPSSWPSSQATTAPGTASKSTPCPAATACTCKVLILVVRCLAETQSQRLACCWQLAT